MEGLVTLPSPKETEVGRNQKTKSEESCLNMLWNSMLQHVVAGQSINGLQGWWRSSQKGNLLCDSECIDTISDSETP